MEAFESFLRVAGATLSFLLAFVALRDARDVSLSRYAALAFAGCGGYLVATSSFASDIPFVIFAPLSFLSKTVVVYLWWFALALFEDRFRLRPLHWAGGSAWLALIMIFYLVPQDLVQITAILINLQLLLGLGLAGHIFFKAMWDLSNDLVITRRRIRIGFALMISVFLLHDLGQDLIFDDKPIPATFSLIQHMAVAFGLLSLAIWLLQLNLASLQFDQPVKRHPSKAKKRGHLPPRYRTALMEAIDAKLYLEADLTIRALADRLTIPEHQLRKLINESLGHQNFRDFLNKYRVEHAKRLLSEPQSRDRSILEVSLDSGFASLASFNRAFKKFTGQTPSEYRGKMLRKTPSANNGECEPSGIRVNG